MKIRFIGFALFLLLLSTNVFAQWDPDLFSVVPEKDCYVTCPGGDLWFSFCISYDGEPLYIDKSLVYLRIECLSGSDIYICPYDCNEKCAYIKEYGYCYSDPNGGTEYSWSFKAGGCCEQLQISIRLKDQTEPFYTTTVALKSVDQNGDGVVNIVDENIILANLGGYDYCSDLYCDGVVTGDDHQILLAHMNHNCDEWIGTEDSSWGAIKSLYK